MKNHQRAPINAAGVWAAGVTYKISEEAREEEIGMPDMYYNVYDADRPEIFFKATPSRTVGPDDDVGIRADSEWDVPEPELGNVLHDGEIVGYTIGNDMSSRSIEGENPLNLPQAKVYDRCYSVGPVVASTESIDDPHDLEISMSITRDDEVLYEGQTSTEEMVRSCEDLVCYYTRHNAVPELCVLLTGTSLVPDGDFTLHDGVERIAQRAFEAASKRDGHLTNVTKSNALPNGPVFWGVGVEEFPDVTVNHVYVDAANMAVVRQPQDFDVVVSSNLFGDILTDLTAAIVGGPGLAPSANRNPESNYPGMFEPVHGSAPDIAGRGVANPLATRLSGALMLDTLGETDGAEAVRTVINEQLIDDNVPTTPDLNGDATTGDVVEDLRNRIESLTCAVAR